MKHKLLLNMGMKLKIGSVLLMLACIGLLQSNAQTFTSNKTGTHDGYYYSFWTEGGGTASMTLGPEGNYSTTWTNIQNFTAGKGWQVGKRDRVVCFEGTYDGGSNGFLAVYGWTKNELIEYYVVEDHGQWDPPGNTSDIEHLGTFSSDGGTYDVYRSQRVNKPSIVGTATFYQFWSVRQEKRSSGTVTFANHVDKWESYGLQLGSTWDYQIMESEGYGSSGSSNITVWECVSCETPAVTTTTSYDYELGDVATQLTANGTNLKWYEGTSSTPLPNAPTPNTNQIGTTKYYVSQTQNDCEGPKTEVTVRVSQTYGVFKTSVAITIDGVIDDVWTNENVKNMVAGNVLVGDAPNSSDLSGYGKMLWDDEYLYVLAVVTDDTQQNDSENSYEDDAVEFYVDINNDKSATYGADDAQYSFGWSDGSIVGSLPAERAVTGITYGVTETAGGYIVEGRIPWSTMQGNPAADQMIGIDFMINDDDDGTGRDSKLSWNASEDQAWQDASLFGTGKLMAEQLITSNGSSVQNQISVYPNPSNGNVVIAGVDGIFDFAVFDFAGRSVSTGKSDGKISVTDLEAGTYLLRIENDDFIQVVEISKF